MCNAFKEVALSVGKVVHRIHFPCVAGAVMVCRRHYAVDDRVAEVHVRVCHIYFGTQYHSTFFHFAVAHLLEQRQVFFDRTVAIRTIDTRLGRGSFLLGDNFRTLFVDIGFSFFDQTDGKIPQLLEIVGCVIDVTPMESEPFYIFLDCIDILYIFFYRVRVVETKVTNSVVTFCNTEIQTDCFGVSYMQIAVWFGRETGLYTSAIFTFCQVFFNICFNKIQAFFAFFFVRSDIAHICYKYVISLLTEQR